MITSKIILPVLMPLRNFGRYNSNSQNNIHKVCIASVFNSTAKTRFNNLPYTVNYLPKKNISTSNSCYYVHNSSSVTVKNHDILNRYLEFINDKKINLEKTKRSFIEKTVKYQENNGNSYYQYPILIYNTAGEIKKFNRKIKNDTSPDYSSYICQDFALAVAKGTKPSVFDSEKNIKINPVLDYKHVEKFYAEISKIAYYFNMDQFSKVLKSIASSVYKENTNTTTGYVLSTGIHAMAINITKKSDILSIEFYDPNNTNIAKKIVLLHPNDIDNITIANFITWFDHILYFPMNKATLFNTETVTETSAATVNILSDITEIELRSLLEHGHYQKNLNIKNDIIIKATMRLNRTSGLMSILTWCVPFITNIIPFYYRKIPGYILACQNKHLDTVANYMDDLLSSNNSIEHKIKALLPSNSYAHIANSLITTDSNLWEVAVKSILKNQNIISTEKVMLLNKLLGLTQLPILCVPFAIVPKNLEAQRNKEVQLTSFKKLANYILETDALTEKEKIKVITEPLLSNHFWLAILIYVKEITIFTVYLDIILDSNKISNKTKHQLVDLHLDTKEKEATLYQQAIKSKNFNFAITYIEKIINSTLTTKTKQQLLNIEDENIASVIYAELEKNHPELANLCCAIIPSYKKIYMKQLQEL